MGIRTATAFAVASLVVLAAGAAARALARRKSWEWPRASGGVVLALTGPVGLVAASAVTNRAVAVVGAAALLALFGVFRDRGNLPRWSTPLVVAVAAGVVVGVDGLRFALGGVDAVDVAWTIVWLVVVTTCIAGLGNAEGLVAGVSGASAAGVVAVASFAQQGVGATVPAALLGGLVGFLAFNVRPASLYMGYAGALFAGFVVSAGALWARPAVERPDSLLVSVLLVAVPLLDGAVVVCGRLRRHHPLMVRARDHLAHRLAGAGMAPGRAVAFLVVAQLLLCLVAIPVARGVLAPAAAGVAAVVVLGVVLWASMRARLRGETESGMGWRVALVVFGFAAFVVLATIPAGAAAYASRDAMTAGREAAEAGLRAARAGETDRAALLFADAHEQFQSARDRLDSIVTTPSLVVPVVGANLDAARNLAKVGADLSRAGQDLAEKIDPDALRVVDGRVPLEQVAAALPRIEEAKQLLDAAQDDLDGVDRNFLVGEIDEGIRKLGANLSKAADDATHATAAARIAPLVLGQDTPRRYLLAVQNPAELRGTGGLVGNWGILTAANGTVDLESLDRIGDLNDAGNPASRVLNAPADYVSRYARFDPARTWQSINISPDFPTVGAVMADIYTQTTGNQIDGVVAVDPKGLAALLTLTGPVQVPDWPTPIGAQNVVDVTLRDAYQRFARTPDRADFLGDVARVAIDRATSGDLGRPSKLGLVLGQAAHEGHISLWFADPAEERVAGELDVSGKVPPAGGDIVMVSNTNAGANKLDYYLRRTIDYSATVTPDRELRRAFTEGTLTVDLHNGVPAEGIAQIAAGPYEGATDRFVYGQNHSLMSIYTPLEVQGARAGDLPAGFERGLELGRNVYSRYVDVFAQSSSNVALDLAGVVPMEDGWYELTLVRQPTVRADRVHVRLEVPEGFEIVATRGLQGDGRVAEGTVDLNRTETVRIKVAHSEDQNLWDRLRNGS